MLTIQASKLRFVLRVKVWGSPVWVGVAADPLGGSFLVRGGSSLDVAAVRHWATSPA